VGGRPPDPIDGRGVDTGVVLATDRGDRVEIGRDDNPAVGQRGPPEIMPRPMIPVS
jgi:hypothetical protein